MVHDGPVDGTVVHVPRDDPRQHVNIRLDRRLVERIDEQVRSSRLVDPEHPNRSAVIEATLLAAFPDPNPLPLIDVLTVDAESDVVAVVSCPHPRAKRKPLGYATVCGDCGEAVRR